MNEYTGIADYYDLLMTSGYYNYEKLAQAIAEMVSPHKKIIEIGVGTGLLLEALLKINSDYNLTGMDHTPAMLEIAEKRLGDRAKLFQSDIVSMSIDDRFDVAISNGGLCAFVNAGGECDFYTHLIDDESNVRALQNVANCLHKDGVFIINVQGVHDSYDKPLAEGIVYAQEICESTTHSDCIEKAFYFKKGDRILAQQQLIYRIVKGDAIEKLFDRAGLKLKGKDKTGELFRVSKH